MSLVSMTGFAEKRGTTDVLSWVWEIRSLNNKGLDLRIRVPEGYEALENEVRAATRGQMHRGSISITLKVNHVLAGGLARVSEIGLTAAISAIRRVEEAAMEQGLHLNPTNAAGILAQRGVLELVESDGNPDSKAAIAADIPALCADFAAMRASEGRAIAKVVLAQIGRIAELTAQAAQTLESRAARSGEILRQRLANLLAADIVVDESRLAQELAVLAVKSDVSEEIDRLNVHVQAAREMLQAGGPIGRKLDFLMQEFNRETNTLCSKAASAELTAIGLDLKVVIDQAREQIQNVE